MADKSEMDQDEQSSSPTTCSNGVKVKEEPVGHDLPDEDEAPPAFGPAVLGLHRVGTKLPPKPTPSEPLQKLNARGMPARIRKKNRFIFVDDFVNTSPPRQSPKRVPKMIKSPIKQPSAKKQKTPVKAVKSVQESRQSEDKQESSGSFALEHKPCYNKIGMRLRNLLKLPKAHKWVCFEYFYSNIDKALFDGDNDFMACLKESFPQLARSKVTRLQWAKIRRTLGKPRRCSASFLREERADLERKRSLIRFIQQRKLTNVTSKDFPHEIPMQLVVGTKVTARLRKPQDGLFTGSIDAVDTSNNTYRITFERPKLGTHSVPDFEVLSNDPPETISLSTITHKFRPQYVMQEILNLYQTPTRNVSQNDPLIGYPEISARQREGTIGGYPYTMLELIIKLTKILHAKKGKINRLKEYNCEAEKNKLFGNKMPDDFERKYAAIVIELETMNMDLQEYINQIQVYCQDIAPGPSLAAMLAPSHLRDQCHMEACTLVARNNNGSLKDSKLLDLIKDLTALMFQVKSLSDSDQNAYELSILQGTMEQIKIKLDPQQQKLFQNSVEIHMQRIQMGLGQVTNNFFGSSKVQ